MNIQELQDSVEARARNRHSVHERHAGLTPRPPVSCRTALVAESLFNALGNVGLPAAISCRTALVKDPLLNTLATVRLPWLDVLATRKYGTQLSADPVLDTCDATADVGLFRKPLRCTHGWSAIRMWAIQAL